ncbi:MAG: methyltransferase domain-containing protein [Burkholderiaceae bacterium]
MPTFANRDPSLPAFWDERFAADFTPWRQDRVPAALRRFVAQTVPGRVLIPGCGACPEIAFFAEAGWDVTAIDFSREAVAAARAALGPLADRVVHADFFAFEPARPVTLVYERAFLCALPPSMWPAVAARWATLLAPGGLLAGFLYEDAKRGGPPFALAPGESEALLSADFARERREAVEDSIEIFRGRETWQVWRRLPPREHGQPL